jgi:hypothetical protein
VSNKNFDDFPYQMDEVGQTTAMQSTSD